VMTIGAGEGHMQRPLLLHPQLQRHLPLVAPG
jgi:hypothetical protein